MELDDWQRDVLAWKGNFVLCTGRQIGKTTIMAIKAAEYMIENKGSRIIIVSLTEDQAKLMIVMILDYLERNHKKLVAKGKNKPTMNKVSLTNGSQALARPVGSTGDSVRGFTGNVLILDEASRMPELAFTAARPTLLTTAGELWICSTPHGKEGYFYECYQNKANRFKVWHLSSEDVIRERRISEGWTETKRSEAMKFLDDEKKSMSDIRYAQEYMGMFMEELRQFFSDELIEKCCIRKRESVNTAKDVFMGCDIARLGGDQTTMEIIGRKKDRFYHVESIARTKILTTETERMILDLNKIWNLSKIGIDAGSGSLGVGIFDQLMLNGEMKKKVIAMNNRRMALDREGKRTQRLEKEDFYDNLLRMMQSGEIDLLDDSEVMLSLKSVQYEFVIKPGLPSKTRIYGNYTHIAEGLIRAAWLAKKEKVNKLFISYM